MRTLGIDLSANPTKTGACAIDWSTGAVELVDRPATDDALVDAIVGADMTGIDVPLGWPDAFVDAITSHHNGAAWTVADVPPPGDREPLRFRTTDIVTRASGSLPLSVSTDRIGVAALRGARLQHLLREAGVHVDRSGTSGKIAEVYPAAALRRWGLNASRYKGRANADACAILAEQISARCGPLCAAIETLLHGCDDDGLDSVVCAIVARAVLQAQTTAPDIGQLDVARREGWIHVPTVGVERIIEP
jgi:predicted nuclease with RNAse H fold